MLQFSSVTNEACLITGVASFHIDSASLHVIENCVFSKDKKIHPYLKNRAQVSKFSINTRS